MSIYKRYTFRKATKDSKCEKNKLNIEHLRDHWNMIFA